MRIVRNVLYVALMQVSNILIGLLVLPYVTGVLGSELLGIHSFGFAAAMYCSTLGQLGIMAYGVRRVAKARENPSSLQQAFSDCLAYQLTFGLVATMIYNVWALLQADGCVNYYLLFNLTMLAGLTDLSWLYAGLERFGAVALRTFAMRALGLLLTFIFVRSKADLGLYIIVQQGTVLLSNLFFWLGLHRHHLRLLLSSWHQVRLRVLRESVGIFLPSLLAIISTSQDRLLLGYLASKQQVALYDYPMRFAKIAIMAANVLGNVSLPRLANLWDKPDHTQFMTAVHKVHSFGFITALFLAGGLMATATEVCAFMLGSTFQGADAILRIACLPVALTGCGFYYIGLAIGREKALLQGMVSTCLLSLLCYFYTIPRWGALGAVWTYVLPELALQSYYLVRFRTLVDWPHFLRTTLTVLGLCLVGLALAFLWAPSAPLTAFLLKGTTFVSVYGVGCVSLLPQVRRYFVSLLKQLTAQSSKR